MRARPRKLLILLLLAALAGPLMLGVMQLPAPGQPGTPAHAHVSANYLDAGADKSGSENLVTGVLLNFRALDTFGEVVVIFTAWLAVVAVTSTTSGAGRISLAVSPVVDYVIRILCPFIAAFALFVIVNGHVLPGGGFQGGVVLGAMMILLSLVLGTDTAAGMLSQQAWAWLRAVGVLAFALVALAGLPMTGYLFGLPPEPLVREAMMIILELGIGLGGGAVLAGLYFNIAGAVGHE